MGKEDFFISLFFSIASLANGLTFYITSF